VSRLSRQAILGLGFFIGLALWLVPAGLFNQAEPWDGNGPAYPLALFCAGFLLVLVAPGRPATATAGLFLGQLAVLVWRVITRSENGELWLVGVVILAGYTFVAAGIGALLGGLIRRKASHDTPAERRVSDRRA
jgi:hypothetical protein